MTVTEDMMETPVEDDTVLLMLPRSQVEMMAEIVEGMLEKICQGGTGGRDINWLTDMTDLRRELRARLGE